MAEDAFALLNLPDNWDSYGSVAPSQETVEMAAEIGKRLDDLFPTYPAQYVPTSGDPCDVQVEWHGDGWDCEVWVQRFVPASPAAAPSERQEKT